MSEIQSSLQAYEIIKPLINPFAEELWAFALDSQLRILAQEMIFRGTVDSCPFHPRDIFRFLISRNATAFILAHNHPSNNPLPSDQDLTVTRKIQKLGEELEIRLLDHLILVRDSYYSMAEAGLLKSGSIGRSRRRN